MTTFLGLLTAFAVVSWGVRWYVAQGDTTLQSNLQRLLTRIRQVAPQPAPEPPPLVPHEAAEQLMQAPPTTEPTSYTPRAEAVKPSEAEPDEEEEEGKVMGYCPRCLARREVAEPTRTTTRKGQPAIRGHCAVCGVGMLVFVAGEEEDEEESDEEAEAETEATDAPASPDAAES